MTRAQRRIPPFAERRRLGRKKKAKKKKRHQCLNWQLTVLLSGRLEATWRGLFRALSFGAARRPPIGPLHRSRQWTVTIEYPSGSERCQPLYTLEPNGLGEFCLRQVVENSLLQKHPSSVSEDRAESEYSD